MTGSYTPDDHELIHAYASLLVNPHRPPLVLAEGLADAIGCNARHGSASYDVTEVWQAVVTARRGDGTDVYGPGLLLARYLIATHGMADFLGYYTQAPRVYDADRFAASFEGYWGRSIEEVWAAMQVPPPAGAPQDVRPICPCGMPNLPTSTTRSQIDGSPRHSYWTLPDVGEDTLAIDNIGSAYFADCQQVAVRLGMANLLFARIHSNRYFVVAPYGGVSRGPYLTNRCDPASVPYDLPLSHLIDPAMQTTFVRVVFQPGGAGATAEERTVYGHWRSPKTVRLSPSSPTTSTVIVCPTCDYSAPECQQQDEDVILEAGSEYHIKLTARRPATPIVVDLELRAP